MVIRILFSSLKINIDKKVLFILSITGRSGPLPNPWGLPCQPNQMFVDHKKTIPLPNTDTVQVEIWPFLFEF